MKTDSSANRVSPARSNGNGQQKSSVMGLFDRVPPHDLEAERAVLGSMLLDNSCIPTVASLLGVDDFFRQAHQQMYAAILALHRDGCAVDPIVLADELRRRGQLEEPEHDQPAELTLDYIGELFGETVTCANAGYYSRIAKRKSVLRALSRQGCELLRAGMDESCDPEEAISAAHSALMELCSSCVPETATPISAVIVQAFDDLAEREKGTSDRCWQTGFDDLDDLTGGMHVGELIFVAARPSIGKTTFAINVVRKMAADKSPATLISSLEQSSTELIERMLCAEAKVSTHRLRTGRYRADDISKLMDAAAVLRDTAVFVDDSPARTVFQIGMVARRIQAKHGLALVVVDYLQLLSPAADDRQHNRETQVSSMSRDLKHLARQLKVPVMVLAQLNRDSEKSRDGRPKLHHLRESGALEQDADVVILLSRDPEHDDGVVLLDVAKQRNGRTGEIKLTLIKDFLRFENYADRAPAF